MIDLLRSLLAVLVALVGGVYLMLTTREPREQGDFP